MSEHLDENETEVIRLSGPGEEFLAHSDIYARIAAISAELRYVQKGSTIKGKTKGGGEFTYKGVSHDAVTNALQPYFEAYQIHAFPTILEESFDGAKSMSTVRIRVVFRCVDPVQTPGVGEMDDRGVRIVSSDHLDRALSTEAVGYGQDYGDKGVGKAYSYAMKYALLKTFFLETGEDDEQRVEFNADQEISKYFVDRMIDQFDQCFTLTENDRGQEVVDLAVEEGEVWKLINVLNGISGDDGQLKRRVWRGIHSNARSYIRDMERNR